MKEKMQHTILKGVFLILLMGSLIQCSPKVASSFSEEEEWDSLPADGPNLSTFNRIFCSSDAKASELYAATEFQRLFREFTGKELPIDSSESKIGKTILIGPKSAANVGLETNTKKLGEEGFNIDISKGQIAIYGNKPRGTLYGVYEFFEKYCGVRFLTQDHTFYPEEGKNKNFRIKGQNYSYVPPFAFRSSHYGETLKNPSFAAKLRTNAVKGEEKFGGITGYIRVSHNVSNLVPPSIYGKEHPEYYALVNGRREVSMHGGGPQLCLTNKDVLDLVTEATLEAIEKDPTRKNFNVAQMDNGSYCTCESCAALDAQEESHAGTMISFVNAVAERVEKTHPEVLIGTYAYEYTRKPPKIIKPRDNVMLMLCSIECCNFHAIDDPTCTLNEEFSKDMDDWNKIAKNIFVWNYNVNFRAFLLPFPNLQTIGKNVEYFANNSGRGVFMQAAGNGFSTELSDLRNYVISRCLWKPGRDSWQETIDFCRMHYKEAAQPIINYLSYYHNLIEKEKRHPGLFSTEAPLCLNAETVNQIDSFFKEALSLAKSEEVRTRVEKASLCVYRAKLSVATMNLTYENGFCKPSLKDSDESLLDKYTDLCAKYHVIMDNEYVKNETYLKNMRNIFSGLKAVQLENKYWSLVVLPESNAKVVEMTYKPTDRNVVQPTRSFDRFRFEEWVREGDGPKPDGILGYEIVEQSPTKVIIALTAKDGARIERTISLEGDGIHFETSLKSKIDRSFYFFVHPEYNAGSGSLDPQEVGVYVKANNWLQVNQGWENAKPTERTNSIMKEGLKGGSFAYFNQKFGFGVEQRFKPGTFENLNLFWSPERAQINLEMTPNVKKLKAGEEASYAYAIHYLDKAPINN